MIKYNEESINFKLGKEMNKLKEISAMFSDSVGNLKEDFKLTKSNGFIKYGSAALLAVSLSSGAFAGDDITSVTDSLNNNQLSISQSVDGTQTVNTDFLTEEGSLTHMNSAELTYDISDEIDLYKNSIELKSTIDYMEKNIADYSVSENVEDFREMYNYTPSEGLDNLEHKIEMKNELVEAIVEYEDVKKILLEGEGLPETIKDALISAQSGAVVSIANELVKGEYTTMEDFVEKVKLQAEENIRIIDQALEDPVVRSFVDHSNENNKTGDYPQIDTAKSILEEIQTELSLDSDDSRSYEKILDSKEVKNAKHPQGRKLI